MLILLSKAAQINDLTSEGALKWQSGLLSRAAASGTIKGGHVQIYCG